MKTYYAPVSIKKDAAKQQCKSILETIMIQLDNDGKNKYYFYDTIILFYTIMMRIDFVGILPLQFIMFTLGHISFDIEWSIACI